MTDEVSYNPEPQHYFEPRLNISWAQVRKIILERDNYQCQCKCGTCEDKHNLQIHHIIPSRHGGLGDLDNLVTLCNKCHVQIEQELRREFWASIE